MRAGRRRACVRVQADRGRGRLRSCGCCRPAPRHRGCRAAPRRRAPHATARCRSTQRRGRRHSRRNRRERRVAVDAALRRMVEARRERLAVAVQVGHERNPHGWAKPFWPGSPPANGSLRLTAVNHIDLPHRRFAQEGVRLCSIDAHISPCYPIKTQINQAGGGGSLRPARPDRGMRVGGRLRAPGRRGVRVPYGPLRVETQSCGSTPRDAYRSRHRFGRCSPAMASRGVYCYPAGPRPAGDRCRGARRCSRRSKSLVNRFPPYSGEREEASGFALYGRSETVTLDTEGRVVLPEELKPACRDHRTSRPRSWALATSSRSGSRSVFARISRRPPQTVAHVDQRTRLSSSRARTTGHGR